jgi:hypothetical protein
MTDTDKEQIREDVIENAVSKLHFVIDANLEEGGLSNKEKIIVSGCVATDLLTTIYLMGTDKEFILDRINSTFDSVDKINKNEEEKS